MQGWAGETYGQMDMDQLESMHFERIGDTVEQLDALTVTKRFAGTGTFLRFELHFFHATLVSNTCPGPARLLSTHRQESADSGSTSVGVGRSSSTLGRASSTSSSASKPPFRSSPVASSNADPAPPYTPGGASTAGLGAKRPPPPPPAPKPRPGAPGVTYVTALYDYAATVRFSFSCAGCLSGELSDADSTLLLARQAAGDLSFSAGDKIELVKKTDSAEDWWTGKVKGQEGVFPGAYMFGSCVVPPSLTLLACDRPTGNYVQL